MKYTPVAHVEIDLTRPLEEMQQLILMVSLSQPNQYEFFKQLDLWMGESITKIENGMSKAKEEGKEIFPDLNNT